MPTGALNLWGGATWYNLHPELLARVSKYYTDKKATPQLLELINKYHPDLIWGDVDGKLPLSEKLKMLQAIRAIDTNIVISGRFCRGGSQGNWGDYGALADKSVEYPRIQATGKRRRASTDHTVIKRRQQPEARDLPYSPGGKGRGARHELLHKRRSHG